MTHRPPNAASRRGLLQAMETLYDPTTRSLDPLAELEQRRLEVEALTRRQGVLPLKPAR
ncbi:MAG TPA: hypothetical protein VM619_14725 [Luteimonas sp.]|nr:hypothetical protein [Luteimonas sp.]